MSYVYIVVATIMFSFVGTFVKIASAMVPPSFVTFSRFFFGLATLIVISLISRKKPRLYYKNIWIWVAVAGKCINYFCENYALSRGLSIGNIIVYPVQAIMLCVFSVIFFKEKLGFRKIFSIALCVAGIFIISWNGASLDVFVDGALLIMILFIFAATGAAAFILSQKMLIRKLKAVDMNLSVFLASAVITLLPVGADLPGVVQSSQFRWSSLLALIGLGIITGGAFLLVSKSLKGLSLVISGLIQSSATLFTLLWGILFWGEKITVYIIVGTVAFLTGLVLVNISPAPRAAKPLPPKEKQS